jgi:hypothetical protein
MDAVVNALDPNACITVTPSNVEDGSSTTSLGSCKGSGHMEDGSSGQNSNHSSEMDSEEEPQSVEEVVTGDMCGQGPCDWETFGEEIWEECQGLKDQGLGNKAVQYHAYRMHTQMRHGELHSFDR